MTQATSASTPDAASDPFLSTLLVAIVIAMLFTFTAPRADAAGPQVKTQAPGFYRFMVGDYEITVVSDGTVQRQFDKIMSKGDWVRQVFTEDHQALPAEVSLNTFLINTGQRLILVDTGSGTLFGPRFGGRLLTNLRAAGYEPAQIDAILLTHMHPDHTGGLIVDGRPQFPNAQVYVDKRDVDFWLSGAEEKAAPQNKQQMFRQAHMTVDPYVSAGRIRQFDGAAELFPGIRTMPAHGHTLGHTAYLVESKGERLLLWGDIIHSPEVQFTDPSITLDFDVDRPAAAVTREKILSDTGASGVLVGSAHISFPGLGHVRADGGSFAWIALPYSPWP